MLTRMPITAPVSSNPMLESETLIELFSKFGDLWDPELKALTAQVRRSFDHQFDDLSLLKTFLKVDQQSVNDIWLEYFKTEGSPDLLKVITSSPKDAPKASDVDLLRQVGHVAAKHTNLIAELNPKSAKPTVLSINEGYFDVNYDCPLSLRMFLEECLGDLRRCFKVGSKSLSQSEVLAYPRLESRFSDMLFSKVEHSLVVLTLNDTDCGWVQQLEAIAPGKYNFQVADFDCSVPAELTMYGLFLTISAEMQIGKVFADRLNLKKEVDHASAFRWANLLFGKLYYCSIDEMFFANGKICKAFRRSVLRDIKRTASRPKSLRMRGK